MKSSEFPSPWQRSTLGFPNSIKNRLCLTIQTPICSSFKTAVYDRILNTGCVNRVEFCHTHLSKIIIHFLQTYKSQKRVEGLHHNQKSNFWTQLNPFVCTENATLLRAKCRYSIFDMVFMKHFCWSYPFDRLFY